MCYFKHFEGDLVKDRSRASLHQREKRLNQLISRSIIRRDDMIGGRLILGRPLSQHIRNFIDKRLGPRQ